MTVAARFRMRDGREFPALGAMDLSLDDVIDVERMLGVGMDAWSSAMEMKALVWLAARQHDPEWLSWDDVGRFKAGDVVRVADPEVADDPPAEAGDEPATPTATRMSSST